MSKKSCAARCSRGSVQGVLRDPAEGEGGVAHREDLAATASATLERSTGTVAHGKRAARERRRRRSKVSRHRRVGRPRAAGAPWEARARAARVQTAGEDLWWWWLVVVVRTPTPNYLRQASPDRGKYTRYMHNNDPLRQPGPHTGSRGLAFAEKPGTSATRPGRR